MKIRTVCTLVFLVSFVPSAWSAYFYYDGAVTDATEAMLVLTPPGTKVSGVFEFSDSAVESGEATSSDVLLVGLRFGGFCFGHDDDCNSTGALVPFLFNSDNLVQFDEFGNIESGALNGVAFSPTFNGPIPILVDFAQGTITVGQGGQNGLGIALSVGDVFPIFVGDSDADGLLDEVDNCQLVSNIDQSDQDSDGFGDFCDPDFSNNCVVNFSDLVRLTSAFNTFNDEVDLTGDGFISFGDIAVFKNYFLMAPGPSASAKCP